MDPLLVSIGYAFWLGIQTAISPCPMATNIAAVSFIGRRVGSPLRVMMAGLLYALGRTLAYVALAMVLLGSLFSSAQLSTFLQEWMHKLLGPVLIVVALFLLDLIQFQFRGPGVNERVQKRVEAAGIWGALLLGILFAMSFCPLSAVLFFGGLIPVAIERGSAVVLPTTYGIGTALPVVAFAAVIAFSAQSVGKAFDAVAKIEWWARRIAGAVFMAVGIFFSLRYCFGVI